MPSLHPADDVAASLAAGAAHDLRNVLFVISAHCYRLLNATEVGDPRLADVHAIKDACDRGTGIARQFLARAQADDRPPAPVDVNAIVRQAEPLLRRLAGEGVAFAMKLAAHAPPIAATPTQIEQVVMNLVVNAREAMRQGGQLTLATETRVIPAPGGAVPTQQVVLSVTDTGTGIDPDVQQRMFEPYFTTKRASGGTGVGLSTVRAIAMLNGGHVEVSSTPGEGTTVRVVFPRAAATAQEHALPATEPPVDAAAQRQARRILLVDDEAAVRDLLSRTLAMLGHDLLVAANGAEAIALCERDGDKIDLIVTDFHLPDMFGPEIATRVLAKQPGAQVVYMSGDVTIHTELESGGSAAVLTKPFSITDLRRIVTSALETPRAA